MQSIHTHTHTHFSPRCKEGEERERVKVTVGYTAAQFGLGQFPESQTTTDTFRERTANERKRCKVIFVPPDGVGVRNIKWRREGGHEDRNSGK